MRNVVHAAFAIGLTAQFCSAQEWQPVQRDELIAKLDASAAKFSTLSNYSIVSTISAYHSSTDQIPAETATSKVWKTGPTAKAEHMGLISYQNKEVRVTIDPEERLMMIAEPASVFEIVGMDQYRQNVFDAATIGRTESPVGVRYRARFGPGSDFEIIEFQFDKVGWLRLLTVHWGHAVAYAPTEKLSGRFVPKVTLEMSLPVSIQPNTVRTDPSEAVTFVSGEPVASIQYSGFEIIDNRSQR